MVSWGEDMNRQDITVSSIGELQTVHVAELQEGVWAWVQDAGGGVGAYFTLVKSLAAPVPVADGVNVVAPLSGSPVAGAANARWFRSTTAPVAPFVWSTQTAWFIDPTNGSDTNSGLTAGTAIKTWAELRRRWLASGGVVQTTGNCTVTLLGDLPVSDPCDMRGIWVKKGAAVVVTAAAKTTLYSGTITAVQARVLATNTDWAITSAGLPVSWTASGCVGKLCRIVGGARDGTTFWIKKDLGAKKATVSSPMTKTSAYPMGNAVPTYPTPQVGDAIVVEDLVVIHTFRIAETGGDESFSDIANRLVFDHIAASDFNEGMSAVFDCDMNIGLAFLNCDADVAFPAPGGALQYFGCKCFPEGESGTRIWLYGGYSDFGGTIGVGSTCFADEFSVEGASFEIAGGNLQSNTSPASLGVLNSPSVGLLVRFGAVATILTGTQLWGGGNGTFGIVVESLSGLQYGGAKPTITGTTNDTKIGGVATAYAGVPAITAANNAAIVVRA